MSSYPFWFNFSQLLVLISKKSRIHNCAVAWWANEYFYDEIQITVVILIDKSAFYMKFY